MSTLTELSKRIHTAVTSSQVEKLMATHCYLHAIHWNRDEWANFWSRKNDISWAHSWGRLRGWNSVWRASVGDCDVKAYDNYKGLYLVYPEVIGMDPNPLMSLSMHTLTNGIIEVAEDGESARCTYLTPGLLFSILNDDEKRWGAMIWERYGADFRYEDGKLLFLHFQV